MMTSETPVIVPPVPTPEIRISTPPLVSRQISSAVVADFAAAADDDYYGYYGF